MDDERGSKIIPHKCKELHGIKILLITRDRKPSDFNSTAEGGGGGAIPGPGPAGLRAGMTLSGVGVPSLCGSPLLGRLSLSFGQMAGTTVGPQPRTLGEWKCLPLSSQPELSGQLCWTQSAWLEPLTCPQTPHSGHEHRGFWLAYVRASQAASSGETSTGGDPGTLTNDAPGRRYCHYVSFADEEMKLHVVGTLPESSVESQDLGSIPRHPEAQRFNSNHLHLPNQPVI